ncbi:MAG: C10 family peptidase, partial [Paludibacteraceae bacterium]|nr:C10 family peptidase [Paludibacteraceae bacterium]
NANGEGWVIVAADDAVEPILAYSETGCFRMDNQPDNIKTWLGKYNNFVKRIEEDGVVASEETTASWNALRKNTRKAKGDAVIGPLITTKWDQGAPFWNSCPGTGSNKAYTGCVATAMAQVMNYWEWPINGTSSHSYKPLDVNNPYQYSTRYTNTLSANFAGTTYDWANMLDEYTYLDAYGQDKELTGISSTAKNAVATLMYHCGVATEMMYGNAADGGSGTYTVNYNAWSTSEMPCAQNALWEFFKYKKDGLTSYMRDGYSGYYSKWTDANWIAMLKNELDKKHPIMYDGAGSAGGHSFICDGYDNAGYFHFNWGWSGSNDGYYKLDNLAPGSGGAGGGNYDFSNNQSVIIGIVPDGKVLPKYKVTWSVKGVTSTKEYTQGDDLVLPTTPANCSDDYIFVGWTTNPNVNGTKPADLFVSAEGKYVTETATYYAVFARLLDGTPEKTDTYTFTSKSWGDATNSWTSTKDASALSSGKGVQVAKTATGAAAQSKAEFKNVHKAVVTYCTTSTGQGAMKITVGDESVINYFTNEGSTSLRELEFLFNNASGTVSFIVSCTNNSIYINSLAITSGGGNYNNYGLDCSAQDIEHVQNNPIQGTKVLIDGQLYILHGEQMYSITGGRVK